jgi:hypothetical protein
MAKSKYLFSVLCGVILILCSGFQSGPIRDKVAQIYTAQIGVREKTGHNDGIMVEIYLHYVGLSKGQPWCASFVCWCYGRAGVWNPRSGGCPDLFRPKYVIYKRTVTGPQQVPRQADIFGLYFPEKGRVAHTGFVDKWGDTYAITTEGNTNEAGSREGDGVYHKRRLKRSIYVVASYIN